MPSGRFNIRMDPDLHAKLQKRAKKEGVSLNTLTVAFVAAGMGWKSKARQRP